jgi:GntR family transcriptional repressor for pyruvate dehydrogenase complex
MPMKIASIKKKAKVTDQVFAQIKNSLMRGELKPGDKMPGVAELAEKMGVGISSIREATKMLEILGVVEARQGEGTFVCNTLREGAANAFELQFMLLPQTKEYLAQFREMYEPAYTYLAMKNATLEDLAQVEAHVIELEEKEKKHSAETLVEAQDEVAFHTSVLNCTHNPYVIKIGEVSLELIFVISSDRLAPLKISEAVIDHRNIFNALCTKDIKLLQSVFQKSFEGWSARFN